MGIRKLRQRIVEAFRGTRQRPTRMETVTLPYLIDWFLENKDAKASDVIAFSYVYRLPDRPPVRLRGLPEVDEAASGVIVVQGYFDQSTEEVIRFRTIYAQRIDDEVAESHAGKEMIVYQ